MQQSTRFALASAFAWLASCAGAWDAGEAPRWPQSPGEIAVYLRPAVDTLVQIDRLTVAVDDGQPQLLPSDGHAMSLRLTPGRHRVEVTGAFRRCLLERCSGSWTFWRRAETYVESRAACSGVIRVDIFDESRPAGWQPEAPMMDLRQTTRCDPRDRRDLVSVAPAVAVVSSSNPPSVVTDGSSSSAGPSVEIGVPTTMPASESSSPAP